MYRAASAYFQTQVTTTSQGELVIMLYDAALKALIQAKKGLEANNMAAKGLAITKAMDILNELDSSLNMEKGGSLSANLHGLYLFCTNHLVKANIQKSIPMVDDVYKILSGLRSAYAEIVELPEAQAAAQEAAEKLQIGNRQVRHQAGVTSGQPMVSAPGAGARARSMYAQSAEQPDMAQEKSPEQAAQNQANAELPVSAAPDTRAPDTKSAPAQQPAPNAPAQHETAPLYGQAPAPANADAARGFPRTPSFGRTAAGAYSNVSGQ